MAKFLAQPVGQREQRPPFSSYNFTPQPKLFKRRQRFGRNSLRHSHKSSSLTGGKIQQFAGREF
jgi:hypothetical protein